MRRKQGVQTLDLSEPSVQCAATLGMYIVHKLKPLLRQMRRQWQQPQRGFVCGDIGVISFIIPLLTLLNAIVGLDAFSTGATIIFVQNETEFFAYW